MTTQVVRRVVAVGGRCEWFVVDQDSAIQALDLAAGSFFMEFDMDSKTLGGLYRILRSDRRRFGSVAHVVNPILDEHLHKLLGAKS